ncbi:MAG: hydantoinase/oxoprolinase family protein, partial [Alphaproteobacteria bacterium]|nr:hydantoinase/oxoprolinase family protein [Alphaproteobacteria bacterium]
AGAVPGPACYGRGGTQPTVTDAALVLGYVDPGYFLGGRMKLDLEAAAASIQVLADQLGKDLPSTAAGIMAIANEHMVGAIREITVNEGYNPRDSVIVAGGGSAGLSIMEIARTLGCRKIVLPRTASALSACGAQYSDFSFMQTASAATRTDAFDFDRINATLARIDEAVGEFRQSLEERGVTDGEVSWFVEARYL